MIFLSINADVDFMMKFKACSDGPNPNTFKNKFKKFKVYFWLGFFGCFKVW